MINKWSIEAISGTNFEFCGGRNSWDDGKYQIFNRPSTPTFSFFWCITCKVEDILLPVVARTENKQKHSIGLTDPKNDMLKLWNF